MINRVINIDAYGKDKVDGEAVYINSLQESEDYPLIKYLMPTDDRVSHYKCMIVFTKQRNCLEKTAKKVVK